MSNQIDEFISRTRPAKRRSLLHDHAADIQRLHQGGYTWQQVADFLNSVTGQDFHRNTVRDWWLRQQVTSTQLDRKAAACAPTAPVMSAVPPSPSADGESHAEAEPLMSTRSNALDDLLNNCQAEVVGMPARERRGI